MPNVNMGQPVKNKHKVPKKIWNKRWSNLGRRVFNDIMYNMRPNMRLSICHPDAAPIPKAHWETLRWNAAWLAADALKHQTARVDGVVIVGGKHDGKRVSNNRQYRKLFPKKKRHAKKK